MASLPAPVTAFDYGIIDAHAASAYRKVATRIRERVRSTTEGIIEIGTDLVSVKSGLDHGQFQKWVLAECGFTLRTAENYMRAAEFLRDKNEIVSTLPPAAIYKLSAKSTPPEIVDEVRNRIAKGVPVTTQDIDHAMRDVVRERKDAAVARRRAERRSAGVTKRTMTRRDEINKKLEDDRLQRRRKAGELAEEIISRLGRANTEFVVRWLNDSFYEPGHSLLMEEIGNRLSDREQRVTRAEAELH